MISSVHNKKFTHALSSNYNKSVIKQIINIIHKKGHKYYVTHLTKRRNFEKCLQSNKGKINIYIFLRDSRLR